MGWCRVRVYSRSIGTDCRTAGKATATVLHVRKTGYREHQRQWSWSRLEKRVGMLLIRHVAVVITGVTMVCRKTLSAWYQQFLSSLTTACAYPSTTQGDYSYASVDAHNVACIQGRHRLGHVFLVPTQVEDVKIRLDRIEIVTPRKSCVVVPTHQKLRKTTTLQYVGEQQ